MKKITYISEYQAHLLVKELNLTPGDSFSNNEPSDLCSEYKMETGYWLPYGQERLVHFSTTKDEQSSRITKCRLELSLETFGIDDGESPSEEMKTKINQVLNQISSIVGQEFTFSDLNYKNPTALG